MSKKCPACNTEYPEATTFCPSDGTPLTGTRTEEDRFIGRSLDGKYLIEGRIGSGGMGNVYRGRHTQMETTVAIKILHPHLVSDQTTVERFRREARAALAVNHPNAIQVMDFGVTEGTVYIVMELLEGISLQKIIDTERVLPAEKTVFIFKQVCAAVGTAHTKNVIHRDLKPDNIFILNYGKPNETVKVLDFSIAKVASTEGKGNLTEVGLVVGTPQYMSPEQAQGMELDTRADIYSLGVTLYQMLTGVLPFTAASSMALALKHIHALPRPLREINPQISAALETVVMKSLAKRPDDRQQTAFELSDELEAAIKPTVSGKFEAVTATSPSGPISGLNNPVIPTGPQPIPRNTPLNAGPVIPPLPQSGPQPVVPQIPTPQPQTQPQTMPQMQAATQPQMQRTLTADSYAAEPKKRSALVPVIIVMLILGLAGGGGYYYWTTTQKQPEVVSVLTNPYFQDMVWIEGNTFRMGRDPGKGVELDETPAHNVTVGDFWLASYETTNAQYQKFVSAEKHPAPANWPNGTLPPGLADMPVTGITWNDAMAYCNWLSKASGRKFRLPTEAEWEYAARGLDERPFPWGKVFASNRTVSGESNQRGDMVPAKSQVLANDLSPFRIFGMAGNVTEWTGSDYQLYPDSKAKKMDCEGCKIMRGGNYKSPTDEITTTFRAWNPPDFKDDRIGFRVAADSTPEDRKQMKGEISATTASN